MTLDKIRQELESYFKDYPLGLVEILKMVEEYAEEAYSDGFEQGWEENDLH